MLLYIVAIIGTEPVESANSQQGDVVNWKGGSAENPRE